MSYKILHVLDHSIPLHSGYTFRTRAILEQQRALGWQTFHLTGSKQINCTVDEETVDGLHFYRTQAGDGLLEKMPILNQCAVISSLEKRLNAIAQKIQPDIIHAHSPALNGVAAVRVGKALGIPVVYETRAFWEDAAVDHGTSSEWGIRYRMTRALETHVFKRANAITTICQGLKNDIIARGIDQKKITVIPNAVNAEKFGHPHKDADTLREQYDLHNKVVLGFIGSFYAYEGLALLLDALPAVVKTNPDARLLLVGGGAEEPTLKEKVKALGLSDVVIFTGRVPHDTVSAYYEIIDVCVYPRLSMRLTELVTPLKPLEAMANRRLVIASNIGGHRELIENNKTGALFPPENAQALADTINKMIAARDQWPDFHQAGRTFVESERTWGNSVAHYQTVYKDAQARYG